MSKTPSQKSRFFYSDVDILSNQTLNLIQAKDFKKAQENCDRLLKEFPDCVDGLDRYAALYAAMGQTEKAIQTYEKVIEFIKVHPGFDDDFIEWIQNNIQELKNKI